MNCYKKSIRHYAVTIVKEILQQEKWFYKCFILSNFN